MAETQRARLPFGERPQTGPKRTLVRARGPTRVSGQELSFGISAIPKLLALLKRAEQLFLFVPIHHPGYQSHLSLEHTIRTSRVGGRNSTCLSRRRGHRRDWSR